MRPAGGPSESGMANGIVVTTAAGGATWWQIVARRRPKNAAPNEDAETAKPLPEPVIPSEGPVQVADIEQAIASAAGRIDGAHDVIGVRLYSDSGQPPVVGCGVRLEFRDLSAMFVQLHWAVRPGETASVGGRYKPRAAV